MLSLWFDAGQKTKKELHLAMGGRFSWSEHSCPANRRRFGVSGAGFSLSILLHWTDTSKLSTPLGERIPSANARSLRRPASLLLISKIDATCLTVIPSENNSAACASIGGFRSPDDRRIPSLPSSTMV